MKNAYKHLALCTLTLILCLALAACGSDDSGDYTDYGDNSNVPSTIDGFVSLGENSVILPGVYIEGNVIIGRDCKIGPNCYIRGNTSIGDRCHVGQAVEIKNSILGDKVSVGHLSYAGDSVICNNVNFGAGTIISNLRHDGRNHRWLENRPAQVRRDHRRERPHRNPHRDLSGPQSLRGQLHRAGRSGLPVEVVRAVSCRAGTSSPG